MQDIMICLKKPLLIALVGLSLIIGAGFILWNTPEADTPPPHLASAPLSVKVSGGASLPYASDTVVPPPGGKEQSRDLALIEELLLVGVVLSSDEANSNAIIEYQGNQRSYWVGDSVVESELVLKKVTEKYAILDFHQQPVTLSLRKGKRVSPSPPPPVSVARPDAGSAITQITHADLLQLTPLYDQDVLQGVAASPKGDSQQFLALGLMSDDIITEINGVSMTTAEGVSQVAALLEGQAPLQVSVRRQGRILTLFIEPEYALSQE